MSSAQYLLDARGCTVVLIGSPEPSAVESYDPCEPSQRFHEGREVRELPDEINREPPSTDEQVDRSLTEDRERGVVPVVFDISNFSTSRTQVSLTRSPNRRTGDARAKSARSGAGSLAQPSVERMHVPDRSLFVSRAWVGRAGRGRRLGVALGRVRE